MEREGVWRPKWKLCIHSPGCGAPWHSHFHSGSGNEFKLMGFHHIVYNDITWNMTHWSNLWSRIWCNMVQSTMATSPVARFTTKTQHGTMHSTIGRWEDHRLPFRPWKCHICHDSFMIWWYDFVSLIQRHASFVSSLDPSSGKVPTRKWSSDLQPAVPLVRKMHGKGKVKHVFLVNFVQF